jgi:2-polyprenyl-3-methyl-5-hydroxy-6-metoxy-1,4-benzoquinol methylase
VTETAAAALARLYDLDLSDDPGDLDLYLALAGQTGGPILELAAGSGRLAVPLAGAGYEVTGVDLDRAMLDRARAAADTAGVTTARRLTLV